MPRAPDSSAVCPCNACTRHPNGPQSQIPRTIRNHLKAQNARLYNPSCVRMHEATPAHSPLREPPPEAHLSQSVLQDDYVPNIVQYNDLDDHSQTAYSGRLGDEMSEIHAAMDHSSMNRSQGDPEEHVFGSDSEPPAPGTPSLSDNPGSDNDNYFNARSDDSDSDTEDSSFLVSRFELFESNQDEDLDDPTPLESLAPGFFEHPAIRNTYICVFVLCFLQGGTWDMAAHMLEGQKAMLATLIDSTLGLEITGLDNMAMTLPTVERRLGLNPDIYICYYVVCDHCWEQHHPKELYKNPMQCVPVKIFPYAPPIPVLQRMLHRPGKYESWQHWRKEGDEPGPAPPLRFEGYEAFTTAHNRINDVYDGWGWRALQAGLKHRRGGKWGVKDIDVHNIDQRFVSLPCGLVGQINIDWFQGSKGSKHSVGAFYFTIKNNHQSIQFLQEETILVAVFLGQTEPSLEELNYLMEPFAADLLHLYNVYGHEQEELVHATLADNCSDLPESRKAGGL
ncbi:hypothetical protein K439DRAFT_1615801 [Ramaria rubella]|nr:hypothetical protein K439DRAFT_1615801 [Ramaria rubella]